MAEKVALVTPMNFLEGVEGLGVSLGKIPAKYMDNPLVKAVDSPIR